MFFWIPFLEMSTGLIATLRMDETKQEALRIDAAHVVYPSATLMVLPGRAISSAY